MLTVQRSANMPAFGKWERAAASIQPGERILIESVMGSRSPTGPIEIAGALPGDVIGVHILAVRVAADGKMWARPGAGVLGEELFSLIDDTTYRDVSMAEQIAKFGDGITVKLRPMVGVVGVAPPGPELPATWPGRHGGNLDCNLIREGAVVFLPVYRAGAGLGLGDLHGRQGDGEVMTSAIEVAGEIEVEVQLHRKVPLGGPVVETASSITFLSSAKSLDVAAGLALRRAVRAVRSLTGLDLVGAGMLLSLIGELGIVQAVNPMMTAKLTIAKDDLLLDVLAHPG
jgi:amidase